MSTDTVRLNITLPKELVLTLNRLTAPRKRSRFITESIKQRIEQEERKAMEKILEEGYLAMRQESLVITKEFEAVDLEGWDEY